MKISTLMIIIAISFSQPKLILLELTETSNDGPKQNQSLRQTDVKLESMKSIGTKLFGKSQVPQANRSRSARLNMFRLGFGTKTRVSPLYLINGTVCRFVNFQPVCTTLSTTGLVSK